MTAVIDSARDMAAERGLAPDVAATKGLADVAATKGLADVAATKGLADVAATKGLPSPVERRPSPAPGGSRPRSLSDPWTLGGLRVANRVVLAPLAGIGSWFVRLQAKRHGAGMAVSEMVSSHAVHHRNPRTCEEMLRIHPEERAGGPTSIQLFGADPEIMRSAAARVAEAGADLIDLNMGCPVPKVCKTGAGAALLCDPDRAVAVARAAREGSGLPVTAKLRPGAGPGDHAGVELARRLVDEVGVAGLAFHPRAAAQHHKGGPDYELAAELVAELPVPVILSGGLRDAPRAREAFERTGAAGVMLARGSLGNPWLFAELLGLRDRPPDDDEILDELEWVMERAVEHHGRERAARNLRRFYPWYLERLGAPARLTQAMQCAPTVAEARRILLDLRVRAAA